MLNDKQMAKLVKKAAKERLYVQEHEGEYLVSDTFWLFKVNFTHKKTLQELAKIFLSLPGTGEKKAIRCKEITDNVPDILSVFRNLQTSAHCHDLKATPFMQEKEYVSRILVNNEFATIIQDDFYKVFESGELKCNGRYTPICIFDNGELEGVIMPIKPKEQEEIDMLDRFVKIAA
jgi:hypothetical protein